MFDYHGDLVGEAEESWWSFSQYFHQFLKMGKLGVVQNLQFSREMLYHPMPQWFTQSLALFQTTDKYSSSFFTFPLPWDIRVVDPNLDAEDSGWSPLV